MKRKRHRPKVLNESKPKTSCKQKLDFDLENCVINLCDFGEPNSFSHERSDQRGEVGDQMQNGFQVSVDPGNSFQEITVGKDSAEKSNSREFLPVQNLAQILANCW